MHCQKKVPKEFGQLFRYLSVGAVLQKFVGDGLPELLTRFAQPKRSPTHYNRGMFQKIDVEKVVQTACENLSLNTGVDEYHHVAHGESVHTQGERNAIVVWVLPPPYNMIIDR